MSEAITAQCWAPRSEPANKAFFRLCKPEHNRKNYLFAGSDRGAERAAALYTLIETAKLNGLDPEAYLRDILTRIAGHPAKQLASLLPWNWSPINSIAQAA